MPSPSPSPSPSPRLRQLKVLHVTNGTLRCGISLYGKLLTAALDKHPEIIKLEHWVADYPTYLPPNADQYDIIHMNWHPATINHIQPDFIPEDSFLSVMFHEPPRRFRDAKGKYPAPPPIWTRTDLKLMASTKDTFDGAVEFLMPVPEPTERLPEASLGSVIVGHSGIRGDGLDRLIEICVRNGWILSHSGQGGEWLSVDQEIQRLARCTVNIAHYHSAYSGQGFGAMFAIAAERPVILNHSRMTETLWKYAGCHEDNFPDEASLDAASQLYMFDDAEKGIKEVLKDIAGRKERRPYWLAGYLSFTNQANRLVNMWKNKLAKRNR